jgi:AraC-like DNA-binding protein
MNDSKGQVTIESLSKEFNISARQLERKFSSAVGLSPKFFTRIIRFQNIFRLVQNKQINSLTMLSYESGYYDQAHFIKDFKEFSGINPRSFFNQEHDLTDLFLPGN